MLFRFLAAVAILCCGSIAISQEIDVDELPRPEFRGLTQKQVSRLVFSNEQAMITRLASSHLVTEAYVQSLGHEQSKGIDRTLDEGSDSVIDDLYFLARVDLGRESPVERLLIGGTPWRERYIQTNTGALEQIFPVGTFLMLFVDLNSFDADRYSLAYKGKETLINTECLVFSVAPIKERDSGRFRGQIWVDSSSLSIVRIKGVFTGPYERWYEGLKGPERYFHFDSWRERIGNVWLPSATYFDERRAFRSDGNLEFHYRGYALLWHQPAEPADVPESSKRTVAENTSASPITLVTRLEADGLLAAPGSEEQRLDRIVRQITPASGTGTHQIDCRVLVTTPAEVFSAGDVIVVSRGLLNIVPDDSVLAVLLARQLAHIVLGHTGGVAQTFSKSLFDLRGKKDFGGLGTRWSPDEEAAADSEAIVLLKGSPFEGAIPKASAFLSQLKSESHRFPNLARARFGAGIFPEGSSLVSKELAKPVPHAEELRFENRYRVSWERTIVDSDEERSQAERRTREIPVIVQTSQVK